MNKKPTTMRAPSTVKLEEERSIRRTQKQIEYGKLHKKKILEDPKYKIHFQLLQRSWQEKKLAEDPEYKKKSTAKWRTENKERSDFNVRNYHLKTKYGFKNGAEDYEELLTTQNGCCAICKTDKCISGKRFAVDHNHETGVVRGLLCKFCNMLLGYAKDEIVILKNAILYLDKQ